MGRSISLGDPDITERRVRAAGTSQARPAVNRPVVPLKAQPCVCGWRALVPRRVQALLPPKGDEEGAE